eukprot:CAMPEP_0174734342 /NCGR_PEP_ID=MMETSP1094-20130205/63129_1 /TAXON_ID=156173 /ORGANISM="Chrysochromulina brevifilum, Strain UTEX LB 985" /LENGTH=114 /DNA_ID=CAMNT_0015937147 /DNA_START=499 /DNA_END=839 /DNA_ORIENTATION=+
MRGKRVVALELRCIAGEAILLPSFLSGVYSNRSGVPASLRPNSAAVTNLKCAHARHLSNTTTSSDNASKSKPRLPRAMDGAIGTNAHANGVIGAHQGLAAIALLELSHFPLART